MVEVRAMGEGCKSGGADANEAGGDFRSARKVVSDLINGRDIESECQGTYAHIWIMGWYHVMSGLLLTWMRTMVPTILKIGAL